MEQVEGTEHRYGGQWKGSAVKNHGQQGEEESRSSQGAFEVGRAHDGGNRQHNKTGNCRVHGPLQPFKPSMQMPDRTCREGLSTVEGIAQGPCLLEEDTNKTEKHTMATASSRSRGSIRC